MHTVEILEQALALAEQLGFSVRMEWLGGSGGGACEIKGKRWLFLDLALSPVDQLDQVARALETIPRLDATAMPPGLARALGLRKSA